MPLAQNKGSGAGMAEPTDASSLHPSGFDPARDGSEMLAILLWDYFGPRNPRSIERIVAGVREAAPDEVEAYRGCARSIAESLRYWRNQELDTAKWLRAEFVDRVAKAMFDGVEIRSMRSVWNGPSRFADFDERYRALARDALEEIAAIATETRSAETGNTDSVEDEGAGRQALPKTPTASQE